jgi:hypothetical protein
MQIDVSSQFENKHSSGLFFLPMHVFHINMFSLFNQMPTLLKNLIGKEDMQICHKISRTHACIQKMAPVHIIFAAR